jgi:thiosulfate sulfurtransferase
LQSVKREPAFGLSQSRQAKGRESGGRNGGGRFAADLRHGIAFALPSSLLLSALQSTMTNAEKPAFRCLPASAAAELIRNEPTATVFDVRDMASYQKAHVEGAAHLSEDRLLAWMKRLPKETPVVIYCYHGNASKTFAQMFIDFRYTRVFSVDGGYEPLAVALAAGVAA